MSDFDLYILKKYLFIPLLVLCIPILWGPALQYDEIYARMQPLPLCVYPEPVFLNVYGAPESIPRNEFRQPM